MPPSPAHHLPDGRFKNPWAGAELHGFGDFLKWRWNQRRNPPPPDPAPGTFPVAKPSFVARAAAQELVATWVGHATVLLQIAGVNVLTDPVWSARASPSQLFGPRRVTQPGIPFDALPAIDVVLLSHNHYDHLDKTTVRSLARRFPEAVWLVPLRLAALVTRWGVKRVQELDWWQESTMDGVRFGCTPAQHFSSRSFTDRDRTLWCGWAATGPGHKVYFAGDTAYHPEFRQIAERFGPFDLTLLPIGAYEPRWFMGTVHMNPEDALRAYLDLTTPFAETLRGAVLPIHWGTFRLTDEAMTEPPDRMRRDWAEAALPPDLLWLSRHGETRRLTR
jgi:N-acyl-phosphatidylethanolamine-hydrolysing phospholipase D